MFDLPFDIETEFLESAKSLGGSRPQRILTDGRLAENSDFVFPHAEVVIELKSLEEDHIESAQIIEKASALYEAELESGKAPVVAFGDVRMTTEGFSEDYKQKIANLYRVPIARLMKKANRQNLSTMQTQGYSQPVGVFLLANNNETALDPDHLRWILQQELRSEKYPGIDVAIAISGELMATTPAIGNLISYWIKVSKLIGDKGREPFLENIRAAWHSHLSTLLGVSGNEIQGNPRTLSALASSRGISRK